MACFWPLAAGYFEPCTASYSTLIQRLSKIIGGGGVTMPKHSDPVGHGLTSSKDVCQPYIVGPKNRTYILGFPFNLTNFLQLFNISWAWLLFPPCHIQDVQRYGTTLNSFKPSLCLSVLH